jgi:hypothetical protein
VSVIAKPAAIYAEEMRFLKVLPTDGTAIHVLQAAPDLAISLNEGRALASSLASRSLVQVDGDMVKLGQAGAALLLH